MRAREYSEDERRRMAEKGHALPDGSYPIADREDLENAIQAIGRAKDPGKAKRHIIKRARALGLEELIPDQWEDSVDVGAMRDRIKRPLARERDGRTDWYRIQNKVGERPAVYIYDEIGFFGDTASEFSNALRAVDADELDVHVNSPGGDIFDGLAIYQSIKSHKAKVTVRIDGLAASIASVIAMAGDKVIMAPKASMMIHEGWTMAVGNTDELRKTAELLDKQSGVIASVYADRSGQPADFWRDRMRDETWYTADEALAAGLVDEVEGRKKEDKGDPFDLSVFNHAGREDAPAPALKAKHDDPPVPPVGEKELEAAPEFKWDFTAFRDTLREGVKR